MKILALLLLPLPAAAQTSPDVLEICTQVYGVAHAIMYDRQHGVSFDAAMHDALTLPEDNIFYRLGISMVLDAYSVPIVSPSDEVITAFAAEQGNLCLEHLPAIMGMPS